MRPKRSTEPTLFEISIWPKLLLASITADRLCFFVKGASIFSISHVMIPDEDEENDCRRISHSEELFQTILAGKLGHFGEASNTPFVDGSQGDHLPPFENTAAHEGCSP